MDLAGALEGPDREPDGSGMIGLDVMNADVTSLRCLRLGIRLGYEDRCPGRPRPLGLGGSGAPDGHGGSDSFASATFVGGVRIPPKSRRNGNFNVRSASVVVARTQSLQRNDFVPIRTGYCSCSS